MQLWASFCDIELLGGVEYCYQKYPLTNRCAVKNNIFEKKKMLRYDLDVWFYFNIIPIA